jgi:hypothetical protein
MSETKYHTHTEPQVKLRSCLFSFLSSLKTDEKREGSGLNGIKEESFTLTNGKMCAHTHTHTHTCSCTQMCMHACMPVLLQLRDTLKFKMLQFLIEGFRKRL